MSAYHETVGRSTAELLSGLREETLAPSFDGVIDTEARVRCPWCGTLVTIGLDPGSGSDQAYAEDCPVCCQAWSVSVRYGSSGEASVALTREGI